jgi:hypothetical protein
MPFLLNLNSGDLWKICQLCSEPMCSVTTEDEQGFERIWFHCHDCDMRNCHEETDED